LEDIDFSRFGAVKSSTRELGRQARSNSPERNFGTSPAGRSANTTPTAGWTGRCAKRSARCCEAWRLRGEPESDVAPSGAIPLPLSAINVGQDDNNQTYLMLEVGGAPLMFGLPARSLKEIGQTLVALSADGAARPS
jgi:hypothetical protein